MVHATFIEILLTERTGTQKTTRKSYVKCMEVIRTVQWIHIRYSLIIWEEKRRRKEDGWEERKEGWERLKKTTMGFLRWKTGVCWEEAAGAALRRGCSHEVWKWRGSSVWREWHTQRAEMCESLTMFGKQTKWYHWIEQKEAQHW